MDANDPQHAGEPNQSASAQNHGQQTNLNSTPAGSPVANSLPARKGENPSTTMVAIAKNYIDSLGNLGFRKLLAAQSVMVVAVASVIAICSLVGFKAMVGEDSSTSVGGFANFIVLLCMALGGRLSASSEASILGNSQSVAGFDLSFAPITTILLIGIANMVVIKRMADQAFAGHTQKRRLGYALINAFLISFLLAFVAMVATSSVSIGGLVRVEFSSTFWSVLLMTSIALATSAWLALRSDLGLKVSPASGGVRESLVLTTSAIVVFGALTLFALIYLPMSSDIELPAGAGWFGVSLFGTLTIIVTGLGLSGSITYDSQGMGGDLLAGLNNLLPTSFSFWDSFAWPLLVSAVLAIFLSIRIGVRRGRTARRFNGDRVWRLPVFTMLIWIVLTWLSAVRISGSADLLSGDYSGRGSFEFGLAFYSCVFVGIYALLVSVLAEYSPSLCYQISPRLVSFLAGERESANWIAGGGPHSEDRASESALVAKAPVVHMKTSASEISLSSVAVGAVSEPHSAFEDNNTLNQNTNTIIEVEMPPVLSRRSLTDKSRKKLKIVLIGLVVLTAIVGIIVGALAYLNSSRKPEMQVEAYLRLLEEGNATAAESMADPGVSNDVRQLLTNDVLANANARLHFISAKTTSVDENFAKVEATYSVNGERFTWNTDVEKGPKSYGVLDNWTLSQPLMGNVMLSSDLTEVTFAEKAITLPYQEEQVYGEEPPVYYGEFYAYPGSYTLSAISTEFETAESQNLVVRDSSIADTRGGVTRRVSDSFNDALITAMKDFAESCAKVSTNMAGECPSALRATNLLWFKVTVEPNEFSLYSTNEYRSNEVEWEYQAVDGEPDTVSEPLHAEVKWIDGKPEFKISAWLTGAS